MIADKAGVALERAPSRSDTAVTEPRIEPRSETRSPPSPRLLVSVRDAREAALALAAGADLIDAKDPQNGALGALPIEAVREILAAVGGRATTSAVAGRAGADAGTLAAAVREMALTGIDLVKVAAGPLLAAGGLAPAEAAAGAPGRAVAVLFAEDGRFAEAVPALADAGFAGVMIDTSGKDGRRLTDLMPPAGLAAFVEACRGRGLICGLAGSLAIADIAPLAAFGADYLGLRGGLCRAGDRRLALDAGRLAQAVAEARALARRNAA